MHIVLYTKEDVRRIRKRLKLTQDKLGALLGVTGNHIAKVESGHTPLSIKLQTKLYEATRPHRAILKEKQPVLME